MGYKTEINYILKASSAEEANHIKKYLRVSQPFEVTKSGLRTYVLNSPIMFADENWKILGMCAILQSKVSAVETVLTAIILTVFTEEESAMATKMIQDAEKAIKGPA